MASTRSQNAKEMLLTSSNYLNIARYIRCSMHVSQLKRAVSTTHRPQEVPACLAETYEWVVEPMEVTDMRRSEQGKETKVLVKWKDLPDFESTWEPMTILREQFPDFKLEDKVSSLPRGIDRLKVLLAFIKKKARTGGRKKRVNKESG